MTHIAREIELAVRTQNILVERWPELTFDGFMSLTRSDIVQLKGAGVKTWLDVKEAQNMFRYRAMEENALREAQKAPYYTVLLEGSMDGSRVTAAVSRRYEGETRNIGNCSIEADSFALGAPVTVALGATIRAILEKDG